MHPCDSSNSVERCDWLELPSCPDPERSAPPGRSKASIPTTQTSSPSTTTVTTPRTNPASRGRDVTRLHQYRLPVLILSPDGRPGQGPGSDRPRQVGDLARRHVHHRRHGAVTPRFSIFLAPVTPSRLTWIGSAGEISPQDVSKTRLAVVFRSPLRKASTITWCRDITDQPGDDEAHRRIVDVNLESATAKTTAVGLNRATRDRSETLSRRARRVGQGKAPSRGGLSAWRFLPFPALQRRDRHDSGHSTADQRGTARRISPLLPGPSNLLRGGNSARRQEMLRAAANLVDRSSVRPRQRARQGSSASRDLCC